MRTVVDRLPKMVVFQIKADCLALNEVLHRAINFHSQIAERAFNVVFAGNLSVLVEAEDAFQHVHNDCHSV